MFLISEIQRPERLCRHLKSSFTTKTSVTESRQRKGHLSCLRMGASTAENGRLITKGTGRGYNTERMEGAMKATGGTGELMAKEDLYRQMGTCTKGNG